MTHPLEPVGKFLILGALVGAAALGFTAKPAVVSVLLCSVTFSVGYVLVRMPQMIRLYQESENGRILLLPIYMLVGNCILPGIIYGIARLFS